MTESKSVALPLGYISMSPYRNRTGAAATEPLLTGCGLFRKEIHGKMKNSPRKASGMEPLVGIEPTTTISGVFRPGWASYYHPGLLVFPSRQNGGIL